MLWVAIQQVGVNKEPKTYVLIVQYIEQCTTRYIAVAVHWTILVPYTAITFDYINKDAINEGRSLSSETKQFEHVEINREQFESLRLSGMHASRSMMTAGCPYPCKHHDRGVSASPSQSMTHAGCRYLVVTPLPVSLFSCRGATASAVIPI